MTLNRYPVRPSTGHIKRAGFPWHRDLQSNGASTMILGLNAPGRLQFAENPVVGAAVDGMAYDDKDVNPIVDLTLPSGDLLVLTGKARWDMLHRVVAEESKVARISLVLGCW